MKLPESAGTVATILIAAAAYMSVQLFFMQWMISDLKADIVQLNGRMDRLETRMDRMETKINAKLDRILEYVHDIDKRLVAVETSSQ